MFRKMTLRANFPLVRRYVEKRGFLPVDDRRYTHELLLGQPPHA